MLHEKIRKALEELGHTNPTPIQEQAIPKILEGLDLRASAQTGTGKTAAFILPALHKLTLPSEVQGRGPRILILVPTRELAMQVATEAVKYSKYMSNVKTVCIYGGAPYPAQNRDLSRPYDILVATPGRLIDHIDRGRIQFSRLQMLILDEADRMLDMGFIEPVEQIASMTPKNRQTLMFSATLKGSVMNLSRRLLNNPIEISIEPDKSQQENIEQQLHTVDNLDHKYRLLDHLLTDQALTQVIVFTSTKHQADQLADKLDREGHHTGALHGDMNQRQRTRTVAQLRKGDIRILVATDVAARGIDIPTISHVINFDLPQSAEDYVHRIGRTGRAGASGIALSFVSFKEMYMVREIEQFIGKKITPTVIPGLEPKFKPQPKAPQKRSWGPGRRKSSRGFSR
ncbi:MAG: DEAD/DEAH box helicase [Chlamydiota bacterium]